VRSCFIADPPNESIRISKCCLEECHQQEMFGKLWWCPCGKGYELNETNPEEYVLVTADMSGAELRIIAELANDPIWIEAFTRGEDVHSVGTHVLYGKVWEDLQLVDCAYFMPHTAATVLKNPNCTFGETQKQKCKCPEHKTLRDGNKSTNFLLAYGGGPSKLATEIKKTLQEAKDLMELHSQKFPRIWAYLEESGKNAKMLKKAFDMFGGRRLFPTPTWEKAKAHAKEKKEKTLRLKQGLADKNVAQYTERHGVPPKEDVLWDLTHRQPTEKEIRNSMFSLNGNIERQGKNHAIQGTNARMAKIAMGCGFSKDGTPYLWHTLRLYKAVLIKFVHDELVAQCPKRYATKVENLIKDAFKRAGAEVLKKVVMESEANSGPTWKK
jgi:DNA polymerase I-like protein with 3'-5' exonuclease and polymerase domains